MSSLPGGRQAKTRHEKEEKMKVNITRVDKDFHMQAFGSTGVPVDIDAGEATGGHNLGARPMELVLMALGSCSSLDIISILRKQKQEIDDLDIELEAKRRENEIPAIFEEMHITFKLRGNLNEEKVKRAVELSVEKYCSVYEMLKQVAKITYSCEINK